MRVKKTLDRSQLRVQLTYRDLRIEEFPFDTFFGIQAASDLSKEISNAYFQIKSEGDVYVFAHNIPLPNVVSVNVKNIRTKEKIPPPN